MAIVTTALQRLKTFLQGQRIKAVEINAELDQLITGHNNVRTDLLAIDTQLSGFATKTALQTPGQSIVAWANLSGVPNLADGSWKTAVPNKAALPLVANAVGDQRVVLDDGDGKSALYSCINSVGTVDQQWSKIGDVDWASDEANRVLAENGRVSNEATRISNESARVSNELARITNENTRVTEFNDIKAQWSQVEELDVRTEVVAARSDGVTNYPTLAARLNGVMLRDIAVLRPLAYFDNVFNFELPPEFGNGSLLCFKADRDFSGAVMIKPLLYPGAYPLKTASGNAVTSLKLGSYYTARFNTDTDPWSFQLLGEGASGNATASDLLSGKTASTDAGQITGTMSNQRDRSSYGSVQGFEYDAGYGGDMLSIQPISPGAYNSNSRIRIMDPNLVASNILAGKSIFGVNGSIANRAGTTAAVGATRSGTTLILTPAAGYYDGVNAWTTRDDPDFIAANIKSGVDLFGLVGTLVDGAGKRSFATGTVGMVGLDTLQIRSLNFTPVFVVAIVESGGDTLSSYVVYGSDTYKPKVHGSSNFYDRIKAKQTGSYDVSGINSGFTAYANGFDLSSLDSDGSATLRWFAVGTT